MAESVEMFKVDPNTSQELPYSEVQIGLVGGLAGDGTPSYDFTEIDLAIALQRVSEQSKANIDWVHPVTR